MSTQIRVGQIWREVDPRSERFVRVESDRHGIAIRTVVEDAGLPGKWLDGPRSRSSECDPKRFNGQRGGYTLHQDVPT